MTKESLYHIFSIPCESSIMAIFTVHDKNHKHQDANKRSHKINNDSS